LAFLFALMQKEAKRSRLLKIFLKIFILQAGDLSAARETKIAYAQAKLLFKNKDFFNAKF
jgi:hypothetical protein